MGVAVTRVVKFIRKGTGISRTDVEYADSTSNSVAPTSGWTTNAPAWQNGHYIWQRVRFIYTDGTDGYSNPVCLSGGKGISKIEEYYLATSASSGVTTATQGWTKAVQSVTATNKYLWNYEVVTYTDGTTTTTTPVIIGTYGDKGVGITSITEHYLATSASSGVTRSTSGWTTTVQSVTATKKYLWNYETVTYTDGSTADTDPVIIGVYGDKGDTGNGISSVVEYYLASSSSSGVTTSTTGWTTDPTATAATMTSTKKYLWNYERINYTDGTHVDTTPAIIGRFGDTGVGITSITEHYLATSASSGVTRSTSGWTTTVQSVTATKKYLWNYETVTYTDGSTADTDPVIIGVYGDKGDQGDTGDSAPAATASPDKITIPCYNGGTVKSQTVKSVTFYLKVGTNDATVTNVTSGTKPTGVSVQGVYNNAVTITVGTDATASGMANGVTFTVTGTYGGKTYSAKVTVALIGTIEGPQGDPGSPGSPGSPGGQGSRGPALRGPQDWNALTEDGTVSYQFYQGADGEPYLDFVIYNGYYYVCKKSHTNKNYLPTNTTYWTLTDKVAMIAASVLFAEHGYFGDAIISGQWLISANGTIDGTLYTKGQTYNSELAYNLFNANSPMGNDISKYNNTETSTLSSSATSLNKATVYLEAGRVYKLTCVGYSSNASNPCYVRLVKTDDSSVMVTPVNLNSASSVTRYGMAHITQSGNYYIQLYHTSTGATGTVTSCELVEKCFAPTYALNLMSGKTYQRDGVFTGFIRKGKTKITTSNINNYKRSDIATATVLDFDKCGSFIELSTGTASYFSLPLLSSAIANRYTTAQKDDIRSFIGTKLLVYNNSGSNLSITYKWTTSGGTYGYTLYNGNCVELECKMDKDDGDNGTEVIYWDVIKTAAPV